MAIIHLEMVDNNISIDIPTIEDNHPFDCTTFVCHKCIL